MRGEGGSNCRTMNQEHSEDIPPQKSLLISYKRVVMSSYSNRSRVIGMTDVVHHSNGSACHGGVR